MANVTIVVNRVTSRVSVLRVVVVVVAAGDFVESAEEAVVEAAITVAVVVTMLAIVLRAATATLMVASSVVHVITVAGQVTSLVTVPRTWVAAAAAAWVVAVERVTTVDGLGILLGNVLKARGAGVVLPMVLDIAVAVGVVVAVVDPAATVATASVTSLAIVINHRLKLLATAATNLVTWPATVLTTPKLTVSCC